MRMRGVLALCGWIVVGAGAWAQELAGVRADLTVIRHET